MNSIKSFSVVAAAAEALSKGIDITKYTRSGLSEFFKTVGGTYNLRVDEATKKMFKLPSRNVYREGCFVYCKKEETEDFEPNLTIDISKVKSVMQVLWEANIETFPTFKEEEYIEEYAKLIEDMDKDFIKDAPMLSELTRDKTDEALKIFLALFNYPNNYSKKIYDDSKLDKVFHLLKAKDYDIIDNRLYIWITPSIKKKILRIFGGALPYSFKDIKAFVVSKNVYDYFWASYGNTFQSCFSLSSEYGYLYGYIPFALAPESFICYATTGGVNKIPIISGHQFKCPNMLFRCWGYADDEGNLLVDKKYLTHTSENDRFVDAFFDALAPTLNIIDDRGSGIERHFYAQGQGIKDVYTALKGYFYADSIGFIDSDYNVVFKYGCGSTGCGSCKYPWANTHKSFTNFASTITDISPNLTLDKPCRVINGKLMNPKTCPVTGFLIPDTDDKSAFAKYYPCDCEASAMITFIDGQVFLDNLSPNRTTVYSTHFTFKQNYSFSNDRRGWYSGVLNVLPYSAVPDSSNKSICLKTLKEMLKGDIDIMNLNGVLLRYFEGSEVKYQFYKRKQ